MASRFLQSCHYHPHAAFAFGEAELTLNLNTFTFVDIILFFVDLGILFRPAESRSGEPGFVLFAVFQILAGAIDFIDKYTLGIMSRTLLVLFDHILQARGLIVCVKAVSFETRPAVANANIELYAKLYLRLGFSAHDRSDPRLAQTDDPVLNTVRTVIVHFFLLGVDRLDCGKLFLEFCGKYFSTGEHFFDVTDVPFEITKLLSDRLTRLLCFRFADAGVRSVVFMRFLAVCARLETDIPIEPVEPTDEAKQKAETDLTISDTLEMLGELGVDVSD